MDKHFTTITFRLLPEERQAFARMAKRLGRKQSAVLRELIEGWLIHHESRLKREGEAASENTN